MKTATKIAAMLFVLGLFAAGILLSKSQPSIVPVAHADGDSRGCSDRSLRGSYGFQIIGTIVGLGPLGGVALETFDGEGNFSQTDNVNINGFPIGSRPGSGSYKVNEDCTGTQTLNLPGGKVVHTTFVIVGNRKQVFDVVTDPGVVITSIGKAVGSPDED